MASLTVLNGMHRGETFRVETDETTLGQADDAEVRVEDAWVSWNHARILRRNGDWIIQDLGSSNGTFVDCVRLDEREEAPLEDGTLVFLGRTHSVFRSGEEGPPGEEDFQFDLERGNSGVGGDFDMLGLDDLEVDGA